MDEAVTQAMRRARFFVLGGLAWAAACTLIACAGSAPSGPEPWMARLAIGVRTAGIAGLGLGAVLVGVGAVVWLSGRGDRPDGYLYDLGWTDLLASLGLIASLAVGAGALAWIAAPGLGLALGLAVALLFGSRMGRAGLRARRLRRILPPPADFWPAEALRPGPERIPRQARAEDSAAGRVYAWNEDSARGTRGVLFLANPHAAVGEPAPAGRVRVLERPYGESDVRALVEAALRS